jgi:hypothetical protein
MALGGTGNTMFHCKAKMGQGKQDSKVQKYTFNGTV